MDILVSESAGVRYLHFSSRWIQGAMGVARPRALAFPSCPAANAEPARTGKPLPGG